MKYIAVLPAVLATPALAHDGLHLHPHDGANWMTIAAAVAVIVAAGALLRASAKVQA
jgi:hypothetical protein